MHRDDQIKFLHVCSHAACQVWEFLIMSQYKDAMILSYLKQQFLKQDLGKGPFY